MSAGGVDAGRHHDVVRPDARQRREPAARRVAGARHAGALRHRGVVEEALQDPLVHQDPLHRRHALAVERRARRPLRPRRPSSVSVRRAEAIGLPSIARRGSWRRCSTLSPLIAARMPPRNDRATSASTMIAARCVLTMRGSSSSTARADGLAGNHLGRLEVGEEPPASTTSRRATSARPSRPPPTRRPSTTTAGSSSTRRSSWRGRSRPRPRRSRRRRSW